MRERNELSLVRGKKAKELFGKSMRFRWTLPEENLILNHIRQNPGEGEKYDNLNDLLRNLDLDGYELVNQGLYMMINRKVKSKILSMRKRHAEVIQSGPANQGNQANQFAPINQDNQPQPVEHWIPYLANSGPGNEFIEHYNWVVDHRLAR
ncbi:hypothetical protein GGS21DRAFT_388291 [Xylaria nigripes]|nr:hypothetical protein GGS21DRAFT_388291 [Xylaria nigripes]